MRLVQHHERIRPQQAGVDGAHATGNAISLKEETRAHHVDRADDDSGPRRIIQPLAVVRQAASQGRDWKAPGLQIQRIRHRGRQIAAKQFGRCRCLVHYDPPVHDVDAPARQLGPPSQGNEPDGHDRRLSQTGGKVECAGQSAVHEASEKAGLPAKGRVAGEDLEGGGEVGEGHLVGSRVCSR